MGVKLVHKERTQIGGINKTSNWPCGNMGAGNKQRRQKMFLEKDGSPTQLAHSLNKSVRENISHLLNDLCIEDSNQVRVIGFILVDSVIEAVHEFSVQQRLKS